MGWWSRPQVSDPSIQETWIPQGFTCWPFRTGKDPTWSQRMCILARYNRGHKGIHQWMLGMPVNKTQQTKEACHPTQCTLRTVNTVQSVHTDCYVRQTAVCFNCLGNKYLSCTIWMSIALTQLHSSGSPTLYIRGSTHVLTAQTKLYKLQLFYLLMSCILHL